MLGNLGNMANLMKMAKDMQSNIKKTQEELASFEATGSSAEGRVEVVMSGDFKLKSIKIQPECIDPEDPAMLEDLITFAMNNALDEVKAKAKGQLSEMTGGLNIPGLF